MTSIEQVDALLAAWDERMRRMDDNLITLESDAVYQLLAGKAGHRAELQGVTRERVYPALDAVSELFQHRDRLAEVVARARSVRASISALSFWARDDKLAEIIQLLRTPSIDLGHLVTPLAERSLLDEGSRDVLLEPEALLAGMVQAFNAARDVILAVSRAWRSLSPAMDELDREAQALRQLAEELGHAAELPELAEVERELSALHGRVQRDPFGVQGDLGAVLRPRLDAARQKLHAEAATAGRARASLARAHETARALREAHARAESKLREAAEAIEDAAAQTPASLEEPLLEGLTQWLQKLESTVTGRRWTAAEVGLTRWQETAAGYLAIDRRAAEQAEALLGRRDELGGRLSARRAQAAALLARGAAGNRADLDALALTAERFLGRRPLPLVEASRAVEAFEAAVRALRDRR